MRFGPRLTGMTVGLAVGITAAVASACAAAAYVYSLHHFEELLANARATTLAEGELIHAALEHQMMENDRSLIARMIDRFGRQPGLEKVLLLDRRGAVQYASGRPIPPGELDPGSPTCQACHRFPPAERGSARVIETREGTVLRTVVPIRNRPPCQRCHDASHAINGILILDSNVGDLRASMNSELRWMVAGSGILTLVLVAAIALVVRLAVLRRLQRFETTARLVAAGDLARRVPANGNDTIAWLAREFNSMADSMTGLVGELRGERQRLETIINSIDDGIAVLDARRRVIAANDAFLQRVQRARHDVLGCGCSDEGGGMCGVTGCPTAACLASGERQVRVCERRMPSGSVGWEEVHTSPIRGAAGSVDYVVEVWRDISERRAAEARLAESHRVASLGLLASGFSHELNTPLATVLMCVEGILRESKGEGPIEPTPVRESAGIAREQLLRCRGITQHFLRMARGQSSAGEIVDVGQAVAAAARLVAPTARANGVRIDLPAAQTGTCARCDEAELQHALINLLVNAVQASPAGSAVTVAVEEGDPVRIQVRDHGCGIAPEHQKRIFEPFFSLRQGGTGLGLFLSLNFVRHWSGDVVVESTPGAGSTFEIRLPRLR
jgi:signal transduction histidine kinase/HAMP domain-containing protein